MYMSNSADQNLKALKKFIKTDLSIKMIYYSLLQITQITSMKQVKSTIQINYTKV